MLDRPLTRNEREVMNYIKNTVLGVASLSHYTGQSESAVRSRLRRLEYRGLVLRTRTSTHGKTLWGLTLSGQKKLG